MDLNALQVFVKVGELQSFTRAAQALGMTQSGVSRAVARLEAEQKMTLIQRNTHHISLTPDGQFLFASSRPLLQQMQTLEQHLDGRNSQPEGVLRLTAPATFGRLVVMPLLQTMLATYPQLRLDTVMTDRVVDIVEEGFDAALRIGRVTEQQLIARPLRDLRMVTVASPDYLRRHGRPQTPDELGRFNCLAVKTRPNGRLTDWRYLHNGEQRRVTVRGNMTVDSADVLLEAALCGCGLVQIMDFAVAPWIAAGRLVEVLPDFAGIARTLHLVYSPSRHRSPKISALLAAFGCPPPSFPVR